MTELTKLAVVFFGAGLGGVARYLAGRMVAVDSGGFPWGTLAVNVTGCLAIGVVGAWLGGTGGPVGMGGVGGERAEWLRLGVMVGVLGGYTTFSAFGKETVGLVESGRWGVAGAYVVASVVLGVAAVWVGAFLWEGGHVR